MGTQLSFIDQPSGSPFDAIKHIDEGGEYWLARELQGPLGYVEWRKFQQAIERAEIACKNSGNEPKDHFGGAAKMVELGSFAQRPLIDYRLTRYACYLVAMNGDPRKSEISEAQTYFAIQTHRQELSDAAPTSPEIAALKLAVAALEAHERRIATLEAAEQARQQREQAGEAALLALPASTIPAPEKSLRADLNERVRATARARSLHYAFIWNDLYRELRYRDSFDAVARARLTKREPLDIVEEAGKMEVLYAIACEVLA